MKKRILALTTSMIALIIYGNGCLLSNPNYTPVKYYSLQPARQSLPTNSIIKIANITSIGTSGTKMIFKAQGCNILVDEYHRWLNPPAIMLATTLQSTFSGTNTTSHQAAVEYTVTGTIFKFIADVENKTTVLGITYKIKSTTGLLLKNAVIFTIPMVKVDPDNYALAMSQAVNQLATQINKTISTIKTKKSN